MRHADYRNLEKNAKVYDDEYEGLSARSVDDHYNMPLSPNSSNEFMAPSSRGQGQQHSLFTFVAPTKQKKKKKPKDSVGASKLDEEEDLSTIEEKPPQIRGRFGSREYSDIQFEMEPEDYAGKLGNEATPVRQPRLETLPHRITTLKISERNDRSVSPQKQSKSTLDSPSVTPRQGVSPVATSRRNENTSSSVTSSIKRRPVAADRGNTLRDYTERLEGRDLINLVVVGHVDAGKSTLMGHLLVNLKVVDDRTMHRNRTEAARLGKESFSYAFVLDESEEERQRGVTMDIAQAQFKTKTKIVNLVDAPGHKDFIPNMINGAAQADVAILVVDSRRGEFETGFDFGGQTREHALLIRSLGVSQLICAVNKMDTIDWSQERFEEIVKKLLSFLKSSGYKESDITFVPVSGWTGENLTTPMNQPLSWYTNEDNASNTIVNGIIRGATLLDLIDRLKPPERPISKPFRLCITDVFRATGIGAGTVSISGRIDCGGVEANERLVLRPSNDQVTVKSILIENSNVPSAFAGDNVILNIQGVDSTHLFVGNVICDPEYPIPCATIIQARIIIFNTVTPIVPGTPIVFHFKSIQEQAKISSLVEELDRSTGELIRRNPRRLTKNSSAVIEITLQRQICCELYSDVKELVRFMLRQGGSTIAAGIITKIIDLKTK
jgi:elongation factor 1 alpha-like protein